VAMLYCHLAQARSLREICNGLAASEGKLNEVDPISWTKKRPFLDGAAG
jgi:Domain of unknown function (DUF4372)